MFCDDPVPMDRLSSHCDGETETVGSSTKVKGINAASLTACSVSELNLFESFSCRGYNEGHKDR